MVWKQLLLAVLCLILMLMLWSFTDVFYIVARQDLPACHIEQPEIPLAKHPAIDWRTYWVNQTTTNLTLWDDRLTKFIQLIGSQAVEVNGSRAVTFTLADMAYAYVLLQPYFILMRACSNGLKNWASMCEHFGHSAYFVVATTEETAAYLAQLNIPHIYYTPAGREDIQAAETVLMIKFEMPHRLIEAGLNVLLSEMDVFWAKDPWRYISGQADIEISQHSYHTENNFGIFTVRSTPTTRLLYRKAMEVLREHVSILRPYYGKTIDQKLMDVLLQGPNSSLTQIQQFLNQTQIAYIPLPVTWRYMNMEMFYHKMH